MTRRAAGRTGAGSDAVGLRRRDGASEMMRWGVSFAAIAAVHAAVAFAMIQRQDAATSNEAPEAAIMIDLPPELALPPAESVESVASNAAEEIEAAEAEDPPPEVVEPLNDLPPPETVEDVVEAAEAPIEETLSEPEAAETLTAEAPEAVEALPPDEVTVSEVAPPPRPRVAERPRPRRDVERPRRETRPVERARPQPQRQQPSRAAAAGQQASGAGRPDANALRRFTAAVRADIMRQRRNVDAQGGGRTATVRFTIGASGALGGVALVGSSGNPQLDAAALAMVRRASPVAPIPAGIGRSSLSMRLPVKFN